MSNYGSPFRKRDRYATDWARRQSCSDGVAGRVTALWTRQRRSAAVLVPQRGFEPRTTRCRRPALCPLSYWGMEMRA
jgi:hypothetical protein